MNGAKDCSQYKRTYELKILRFFFQHDNDRMMLTPSEASEEN